MESTHTPGPWVDDELNGASIIIAPYSTLGFDSEPIASVTILPPVDDPDPTYLEAQREALKNLSLIAAAPDLLAALKAAAAYPTTGDWHEQASAAIAKAEGRAA